MFYIVFLLLILFLSIFIVYSSFLSSFNTFSYFNNRLEIYKTSNNLVNNTLVPLCGMLLILVFYFYGDNLDQRVFFNINFSFFTPSYFSWSSSPFSFLVFCYFILIFIFLVFYFKNYYRILSKNITVFNSKNYFDLILIFYFFLVGAYVTLFFEDLLYIYVGIEILALSSIVLAGSRTKSPLSVEASIKYLVMASLSSGIMLLSLSIFYFSVGSLDLVDLSNFVSLQGYGVYSLLFFFSIILCLISIFFKLAAAPFHSWSPDVYDGVSLPTVAVFSIFSKNVYALLLLKLYFYFFYYGDFLFFFELFFKMIILFSLIIGISGALLQKKIKKFMAYSGISHISFFLLPLLSLNLHSFSSFIYYLLIYSFTLLNVFCVLLFFFSFTGRILNSSLKNNGLFVYNPMLNLVSFTLILCFLSLGGLPPFVGFFAKFQILKSLCLNVENIFFCLIILLISSISLVYYIRFCVIFLVKVMEKKKFWTLISFKKISDYYYNFFYFFILLNIYFFFKNDSFYGYIYYLFWDGFFFQQIIN